MDGWDYLLIDFWAVDHGDKGERLLCVGSKARQGPQVNNFIQCNDSVFYD